MGWSLRYSLPIECFKEEKRKMALFHRRSLTVTMVSKSSKFIATNHEISRCHEAPDVMHCAEKKQERPNIRQIAHSVGKKKARG